MAISTVLRMGRLADLGLMAASLIRVVPAVGT
jgi:hypothetical protein